ncbi:MAG: carbohydrate ABC transporter substrate-binding protein [Actinobacteria bacterium]|nr:carbohydrate ABC transporter substrate-binding protein [Actinomycetota bacterium]
MPLWKSRQIMNGAGRWTRLLASLIAPFLALALLVPSAYAGIETITVYTDGESIDKTIVMALAQAFEKENPRIRVQVNIGPTGVQAVDLVQKRIAAGKMDDVFLYYSGSLFEALDPVVNLVELTDESWQSSVLSSYYPAVSTGTRVFGAPVGSAMGGGILYNKSVYKKLGLKIPLTWSQFMKNNAVIKKAGITPVIATYKDTWTAQLFVLSDFFNVQAAFPNFAAVYTANRTTIADTPAAMVGFQHLEDVYKAGYINKDFATANPFVAADLAKNYPKQAKNIGFFAQPGPSAASNGLTVWMPNGLFIPKSTKHLAAAKKFISYAVSPAAIKVISAAVPPSGPYLIKGAKLSGPLSSIASDMLPYFQSNDRTAPALEFVSPIKGPKLSAIAVQVGSGKISAHAAARAYDADVRRESIRLGLPGWGKLPG